MADLVSSFLNIFSVSSNRAVVEANNMLSRANAEAGNKVRQASNELTAAKNSLARWTQSVNNQRLLKQGGEALEASVVNYRRGEDELVRQSFSQSIAEAEQAGMAAASAAAAGVAGSVVDTVNMTTALRDSIVRQEFADARNMAAYDTQRRAGTIMSQVVGGLDNSLILDSLDFNIDVAQRQAKPSYFPAVLDFAVNAAKAYATMGASEAAKPAPTKTDYSVASAPNAKFGFNFPTSTNFLATESVKFGDAATTSFFSR